MKKLLFILLYSVSSSFGATFFFSDKGFGESALKGDTVIHTTLNAEKSIHMYYDPEGQDVSEMIDMSFEWSNNGIAEFETAEIINYDIVNLADPSIKFSRWGTLADIRSVSPNEIRDFTGIDRLNSVGMSLNTIPPHTVVRDQGYDVSASAFHVGTINISVGSYGSTDLNVVNPFVSNFGMTDIGANFQTLTVSSTVPIPVPEASTLLFVLFGGFFFLNKRKR